MKTWDDFCDAWAQEYWAASEEAEQRATEIMNHARLRLDKLIDKLTAEDLAWFAEAMKTHPQKIFTVILFEERRIPEILFEPFLRAAVMEKNPSVNRYFIEPCCALRSAQKVYELLLAYLDNGSNEEKAGAVSASYWVQGYVHPEYVEHMHIRLLREFIDNEDTHVRRQVVSLLELDLHKYQTEVRPLIEEAILIARAHPDEYIRHRIEVQLGSGEAHQAIPA